MAAYFYTNSVNDIFKVKTVQNNVYIGFITNFINGQNGTLVISEVVFQNRDTIQYFLTFDDLITYFYFGKGLGTVTISGSVIADLNNTNSANNMSWFTLGNFMQMLGSWRGKTIGNLSTNGNSLIIGGISMEGVLSSFTIRASAQADTLMTVDFTLQLDIINSNFISPNIASAC
jgi:hypothetical protein